MWVDLSDGRIIGVPLPGFPGSCMLPRNSVNMYA